MPLADYAQFEPNPSVPGGLRSSAHETIHYAQMIIDRGWYAGQRVLSEAAIERMFTNHTRGLPVYYSPWPPNDLLYPYGVDPDYAFGAWVLAENPVTQHVEEIVGAGAWGSYLWVDRRRGLTAVLITDVPPGSLASAPAALGLFDIARRQVEDAQARSLAAVRLGDQVCLSWEPAPGSDGSRIYGAPAPIDDVFKLGEAAFFGQVSEGSTVVSPFAFYAVTAAYQAFENPALVPEANALATPVRRPDLDSSGSVTLADFGILATELGNPGPDSSGDVDGDGDVDLTDFADLQRFFGAEGCPASP